MAGGEPIIIRACAVTTVDYKCPIKCVSTTNSFDKLEITAVLFFEKRYRQ
jgi:hypothetical protein